MNVFTIELRSILLKLKRLYLIITCCIHWIVSYIKKCYSEELGAIDTDKYEREYKRDLIIIDEAHNTESFLMDLISVSIRLNDEKDQRWYMSNPAKVPEVKELLQVSIDGLYQMVSDIKYQIENSKDDNILKLGKRLATISRKIQKLEYLQLTIENGNWAFVRDIRVNQDTNKKVCSCNRV